MQRRVTCGDQKLPTGRESHWTHCVTVSSVVLKRSLFKVHQLENPFCREYLMTMRLLFKATPTMTAKGQQVALRGDVKGGGPVREGQCPEDRLVRDAVELDHPLQAIANTQDHVGVSWTEPGQARGEELVLALEGRDRSSDKGDKHH